MLPTCTLRTHQLSVSISSSGIARWVDIDNIQIAPTGVPRTYVEDRMGVNRGGNSATHEQASDVVRRLRLLADGTVHRNWL